jgi:NADH-quinone oxidoreductase subunit N
MDMLTVSPLLFVVCGALAVMLLEVFNKRGWPRAEFGALVLICASILIEIAARDYTQDRMLFGGVLYADRFTYFCSQLILIGATLGIMLSAPYLAREGIDARGEYYALYLFSVAGALVLVSSAELITLFIALELMSLALYCMTALALRAQRSVEAGLKYFLLGSFSSAFLLYGIALLYGAGGSTFIASLSEGLTTANTALLSLAIGLTLMGLIFKLGGVPFHFWVPDVYEGAPAPVTIYMACVVKAAAVGMLLRIMWLTLGEALDLWAPAITLVAVLSMTVGNLIALRQQSVKRMLAYSSIAHVGYMLCALVAKLPLGGAAILYYLVAYLVISLGAFGVIQVLVTSPVDARAEDLSAFNGLSKREPLLAGTMALFMLALAGIPPGFAGLLGKFYVFSAALDAGYIVLVVAGVLNSAVSCFYYLRVVVAMYFHEPQGAGSALHAWAVMPRAILVTCAILVIVLGLLPGLVHNGAMLSFWGR